MLGKAKVRTTVRKRIDHSALGSEDESVAEVNVRVEPAKEFRRIERGFHVSHGNPAADTVIRGIRIR